MNNLDKAVAEIQAVLDNYKRASQGVIEVAEALKNQPVQSTKESAIEKKPTEKPQKLYEAAVKALEDLGKPAKTAEIQQALKRYMRKKVATQNVYVALDYARKHGAPISRDKGTWSMKSLGH